MAQRENKKEEKSRLGTNQRRREEIMRDMPGARSQAVRHRNYCLQEKKRREF